MASGRGYQTGKGGYGRSNFSMGSAAQNRYSAIQQGKRPYTYRKPAAATTARTAIKRGRDAESRRADYRMAKSQRVLYTPSSTGTQNRGGTATYTSTPNGGIVVKHREYIGDITQQADDPTSIYIAKQLRINPGSADTFPWLHGIGLNFTKYKFRQLSVKYAPQAGTDDDGTVIMAAVYDPTTPLPLTKQLLLQQPASQRGPLWAEQTLNMARSQIANKNADLVSLKAPQERGELILTDPGYIVIAVQGSTQGKNVGELWVQYEVELTDPQPPENEYMAAEIVFGPSTSHLMPFETVQGSSGELPWEIMTNLNVPSTPTALRIKRSGNYRIDMIVYGNADLNVPGGGNYVAGDDWLWAINQTQNNVTPQVGDGQDPNPATQNIVLGAVGGSGAASGNWFNVRITTYITVGEDDDSNVFGFATAAGSDAFFTNDTLDGSQYLTGGMQLTITPATPHGNTPYL